MSRSSKTKLASPPRFIEPCLATLAGTPPTSEQWVHEIKFDGYRLQARIEGGRVRLLTRTGLDWTDKFRSLVKPLADLAAINALIDGEVIVEGANGASDFTILVGELKAQRSGRMVYIAFDLLFLNGRDLRGLTLTERKTMLTELIGPRTSDAPIRYSEHLTGDATEILSNACRLGLEGIVSKRIDKPYRSGRRAEWLKAKCVLSDEFVIVGYLDSSSMTNAIGALALGVYEGQKLVYVGRVGTGFTVKVAANLWDTLQSLRVEKTPLAEKLAATKAKGVVWTRPQLVAQIEYRAWTFDGIIRHAVFKSLRHDTPAPSVGRPGG